MADAGDGGAREERQAPRTYFQHDAASRKGRISAEQGAFGRIGPTLHIGRVGRKGCSGDVPAPWSGPFTAVSVIACDRGGEHSCRCVGGTLWPRRPHRGRIARCRGPWRPAAAPVFRVIGGATAVAPSCARKPRFNGVGGVPARMAQPPLRRRGSLGDAVRRGLGGGAGCRRLHCTVMRPGPQRDSSLARSRAGRGW